MIYCLLTGLLNWNFVICNLLKRNPLSSLFMISNSLLSCLRLSKHYLLGIDRLPICDCTRWYSWNIIQIWQEFRGWHLTSTVNCVVVMILKSRQTVTRTFVSRKSIWNYMDTGLFVFIIQRLWRTDLDIAVVYCSVYKRSGILHRGRLFTFLRQYDLRDMRYHEKV